MVKRQGKEDRVVFRKQDRVGANDAEEDAFFLSECFVDTGDLQLLRDCGRPERIVLGRTGSGKSALLLRLLSEEQRAIEIRPENLALAYISNSTIIRFFEELGVNLEPFYKLIWRHAFCVELLRARFGFKDSTIRISLMDKVRAFLKGSQYSSAMRYLETWGDKFWEETETRVQEITSKVEETLRGSLKGILPVTELSGEQVRQVSHEQKTQIIQRAQKIVNDAHVPQLNQILDLVRDVLNDQQQRFYLVIDRLDESWAEDQLRYKLIMALVETVKDFRRVPNAKIIMALRVDLLQRVYKRARTAGFQEEKLDSLCLKLRWNPAVLTNLLDARVNYLFRDRYSKNRALTCQDIMAEMKRESSAVDYILERTFLRPRDAIAFLNDCIASAEGRAKIALKDIKVAELVYSQGRLKSVADEWHVEFPNLLVFVKALLSGVSSQVTLSEVMSTTALEERCLSLHGRDLPQDELSRMCGRVVDATAPCSQMLRSAASIFFRVGIIGVKGSPTEPYSWHADTGRQLDLTEFSDTTSIKLHPMFWAALGVRPVEHEDAA
jgi:hypothetical protein